jgi:hypothetical protein
VRRSTVGAALDALAALCFIVAISVELRGGFVATVFGLRISMRSADRAMLVALAVVAVRLFLDRQTPVLGSARAWLARMGDAVVGPDNRVVPPPLPGRARRTMLAAVGICAVAAVLLAPQMLRPYGVPDLGDPLFSIWRMAWVPHQLLRDPLHLFDANIFYPDRLTLTYSDSMILPAITAAPLLAAGVHPVVAYNLLFVSGFVFSGITTYLLVERLTAAPRAAFVAALIYGFYPYRFEHYSHLELQMTHWMPLALLAVHLFLDTGRFSYALAAAAAIAAQLYSSMYYAVFFALYVTAVAVVLARASRLEWRRLVVPLVAAAAVLVLLALPIASAYVASAPIKGERDVAAVRTFSARPSDYLRSNYRSALYGPRLLPGRQPERALFPGVMPLVCAGAALVPPLGSMAAAYVAGLIVAFDGSLGFNGVMYPRLYQWLSPVRSMRVPARFSIVGALSLAVLAGFGVQRFLARFQTRTSVNLAFAALVAGVVIDAWPVLKLTDVWPDPPPIYSAIQGTSRVVLAEFPVHDNPDEFAENTAFMYFSLWHWKPMVNGYSGVMPAGYREFVRSVRGFPSAAAIQALRLQGVTHVTVNCVLAPRGCEQVLDGIAASGAFRRVAEGKWRGGTVHLYELQR